jgi:ferredoxin-NADP reductase
VKDDFKLVYFSSFADEESGVYHQMCDNLHKLDKKYNLNIFHYVNRLSNKNNERWNVEFLCKELAEVKNSITRTFICGPTGFLDDIKKALIDGLIVEKDKIFLV